MTCSTWLLAAAHPLKVQSCYDISQPGLGPPVVHFTGWSGVSCAPRRLKHNPSHPSIHPQFNPPFAPQSPPAPLLTCLFDMMREAFLGSRLGSSRASAARLRPPLPRFINLRANSPSTSPAQGHEGGWYIRDGCSQNVTHQERHTSVATHMVPPAGRPPLTAAAAPVAAHTAPLPCLQQHAREQQTLSCGRLVA